MKKGDRAVNFSKLKLFLLLIVVHVSTLQSFNVSFDVLFPSTPYKQVLNTCMQIRNSIASMQTYQNNNEDYAIYADLISGRMVFLDSCVDTMLKSSSILADDLEYLLNIMDYMTLESKLLNRTICAEHVHGISKLIAAIKHKLEQRLSSCG